LLIVNGPNLNLLGEREPEIYGSETLHQLNDWIAQHALTQGHQLKFYQSNHEGEILDYLQGNRHWADGVVLNAGALTHYSYALADCITACQTPTVEVHISDIHKREEFRKNSVVEAVCIKQISGFGKQGYIDAVQFLETYI
ncbi:UNVERIFIED_CONTAM: hypothetical protein GTU68_050845, partial [Idotea baltica]|nr:hypothetical protein [Idotea baltica]